MATLLEDSFWHIAQHQNLRSEADKSDWLNHSEPSRGAREGTFYRAEVYTGVLVNNNEKCVPQNNSFALENLLTQEWKLHATYVQQLDKIDCNCRQKNAPHFCGAVCCKGTCYLPVPVRLEVCGLPTALSDTLNVPVLVPVAVGVNTTLIVHLDLAARLLVQVVAETLKSPVVEITMPVSATACLLERVSVFAGLVVPTFSVANFSVAGVRVA